MNSKCRFVNIFSGFIDNSKCKISIWVSFPNMIDQYCFCIITIFFHQPEFHQRILSKGFVLKCAA